MRSPLALAFWQLCRVAHFGFLAALAGTFFAVPRGRAAEEESRQRQPAIVVPASAQTLHIAAVAPKGEVSGPVAAVSGLVEIGGSTAEIPAQGIPGTSRGNGGPPGPSRRASRLATAAEGLRRFRLVFGKLAASPP